MRRLDRPAELSKLVGQHVGTSPWHEVSQESVDAFASLTGDRQWIHVDRERAVNGPFGGAVAHGFLVMAMIPAMLAEVVDVGGVDHTLNKGIDRVRLSAPVLTGQSIRARVGVESARVRPRGYWESVFGVAVEAEGAAVPVLRVDITYLFRES